MTPVFRPGVNSRGNIRQGGLHMRKPVLMAAILALTAVGLCSGPAGCGSRLQMHPYCTARLCPECPQPLDLEVASPQCRKCLDAKLQEINQCSQEQPSPALDQAFIGVWRSSAGLRMRVVQIGREFTATLIWAPDKLRKRYPQDGVKVLEAKPDLPGRYIGRLLAPNGQWIEAVYILGQKDHMESVHPGDQKVNWRRVVELKLPDHRPVPGGPPPPGVPPDRPAGAR